MGPTQILLAPFEAARLAGRAVEDLHDLAERARRDPDPVEEVRERIDSLFARLDTLEAVARSLDATAAKLVTGGEDLLEATRALHDTARTIVAGGDDLRRTGERLDAHARRLIAGLGTVEQLEDAVETVADTVEPLQGVTKGVGRVADRLGSSR